MVSQPIWIGIVIAAFVVGLGSTYLIFHTGSSDVTADFNMMENAQHAQEMAAMMNANHDFTMEMMSVMIEDPALQLQMIGHLAENPEAMKQIVNLVNQEMIMSTMQDSDQMQMMEDMMADMMERMQTDPELEQAMMEHMDRMKLSRDVMMGTDDSMMNDMMDTKTDSPSCTSDWYITGYFLPLESDYSGKSVEISVDRTKQFYLADFLEFVKIEGWGRTNAGNYLGWYHGAFTISDRYLDAYDNDLIVGMVAVDNSVIEHGSELTIPTLPEPWNDMVFSGSDEGPSIIGKHIDVFTGEGIDAENETFRITGYNNQVCVQN
ncbi:MAG: 3D domain-containing protein [Nitrosopumilus sp.]